jgi:saccharopine dehydrogenase-like NADP-dependent oxidoreductase
MGVLKKILLFGAGKSATVLINYLIQACRHNNWQLIVADGNLVLIESKLKGAENTIAVEVNVQDDEQRKQLIGNADLVISMLPASLHYIVANNCITAGKHLLTASYVDDNIKGWEPEIKRRGILFLCETGLDPGIDHMSAMQLIYNIRKNGGVITSFYSHCGGLVAPESDDNPWHYKISWNARNIILAGKSGAIYKQDNGIIQQPYTSLFDASRTINVPGYGNYAWYPNRDSISYSRLYDLENCSTFIRTTLRHPDFCLGWKKIVAFKLTDEVKRYDTTNLTYLSFFKHHLSCHQLIDNTSAKEKALLSYMGLYSNDNIGKGMLSAAEIIQTCAENKLMLQPHDRDMIIMMHEIAYEAEGIKKKITSSLVVKGENNLDTAMAKTVGLPLGIAAVLILQGKINLAGLHIPILPEIYEPVLKELGTQGILFNEKQQ